MPKQEFECWHESEGDADRISAYDAEEAALEFAEAYDNNAGGEIGHDLMQNGGSWIVHTRAATGEYEAFDVTAEATVSWIASARDGPASAQAAENTEERGNG